MSRKRSRPNADYLRSVQSIKKFVPSVKKYARRKKLNRWEKAAITRAEKKLKAAGNVVAISKRDILKIKDKSVLVGNGVQAIRLDNAQPGARLYVNKRGAIKVRSGGRTFFYVRVAALDEIPQIGEQIFGKYGDNKVTVWLWMKQGRANKGSRDALEFARYVGAKLSEYKAGEQYIYGVVYLPDPAKNGAKKAGKRDRRNRLRN